MRGGEKPDEDLKSFEDTYYAAWLYISTSVYEKLIKYIEQYKVWAKQQTEENKNILNEQLTPLMQAIRDEVTVDKKAEFTKVVKSRPKSFSILQISILRLFYIKWLFFK